MPGCKDFLHYRSRRDRPPIIYVWDIYSAMNKMHKLAIQGQVWGLGHGTRPTTRIEGEGDL